VALVVFDEVEVLDFAGPFEVFAVTEDAQGRRPFRVRLWGLKPGPIRARNGLTVVPDALYTDEGAPTAGAPDVLIVPGGLGAETSVLEDRAFLGWLAGAPARIPLVASVCTGAFPLAEAGLFDGRRATTHHLDFDTFARRWPRVDLVRDRRWVDEGPVVSSGGISAGIDMALHLVARLEGLETARRTAARMEYRWQEEP